MTQRILLTSLATLLLASSGFAAEVMSIAVYPPEVNLTFASDKQPYVVVATRTDGVTLDVTSETEVKAVTDGVVSIEGSTVKPVADGTTELQFSWQGQTAATTATVKDSANKLATSFHLDIMPIFMRSGCNTGSCHGAARGKDGFRLSLFGFDPKGDHYRLTHEIGARRINLGAPAESLLIEKSIGAVPHTGGTRFDKDSEYYRTMLSWLTEGAKLDEGEPAKVVRLEVFPPKVVLEGSDTKQQFIARAVYSDGHDRDVTNLTVFMTNNDTSAPINENGLVTAAARGEAFVMARYETHTVGSQVIVLPDNLNYTPPKITGNYIDELVGAKLMKLRILPSGKCSDEEFLRRVTIDIAGKLPSDEEYTAFMSDSSPDKRSQLIDRLLERKEFSEIWAMKWADLLMLKSSNQVSYKSIFLYNTWLTNQISNDVPLDQTVRDLLTASGGTFSEPATNFYQIERDQLKTAENVAQIFMGIRIQCAQCHNHPFDRWTMDDYYGFTAFFAQISQKQGEDYRERIIYNRGSGETKHPLDKRNMAPKPLGAEAPDTKGIDRRAALAEWLTSPENPYFSTSVANRVWAHFFGVGIVEPIDDIRVSNPASNPELFDALGKKLVEYNYDFKQLVRDICNSEAYQRSTERNESNKTDELNFAHATVRRIPAEMLLDCISQVTQTKDKFKGLPLGARAVQIADGNTRNYFLSTFGRSDRDSVCSCEASIDPTLSQALHLINGDTTGGKIVKGKLINELIAEGKTPQQAIETLYQRAVSRKPTEAEMKKLMAVVTSAESPQVGLEDVFWALLNSREFLFNH